MIKIVKSCLIYVVLVSTMFINNSYSSNNMIVKLINSDTSIAKLEEYTSLFRGMRKYKAQLCGATDNLNIISEQVARQIYACLNKIVHAGNMSNTVLTTNNLSNILSTNYNTLETAINSKTGISNPIFKIMQQPTKPVTEMNQDEFYEACSVNFIAIVNNLLWEHFAFISDYSPSNKGNEVVVNLFTIAWNIIIKFAYDNGYKQIAEKLFKFFTASKNMRIALDNNWIGIQLNNYINNTHINNNNINNQNVNNQNNNVPMFNTMNNMQINNNHMNNNMQGNWTVTPLQRNNY